MKPSVPRLRGRLHGGAPPLAAGAPGHPIPPGTRPSVKPSVPGLALRGAPGRPLDSRPPVGRPGAAERMLAGPAWEFVALAVALAAAGRLAEGPALWAAALLAAGALGFAAIEVLGAVEPEEGVAELGIPVEAALPPAIAGIAGVTALHLVPVGLLLVPGLVAVGAITAAAIEIERRILARISGATTADRSALLALAVVLAFLAFAGIAAAIPGALVEPLPTGEETGPPGLSLTALGLLAALDGLVAGSIGYRLAALEATTVRRAALEALSYAAVVAIAAAALRAMGLPRLLGPALLALVLYLWSASRGVPRGVRRDARWAWELLLLGALGALVVAWNVLAQG